MFYSFIIYYSVFIYIILYVNIKLLIVVCLRFEISLSIFFFFLIDIDPQEHLAKQREILNKHLGLSFSPLFGIDSNYLSNEDFEINRSYSVPQIKQEKV